MVKPSITELDSRPASSDKNSEKEKYPGNKYEVLYIIFTIAGVVGLVNRLLGRKILIAIIEWPPFLEFLAVLAKLGSVSTDTMSLWVTALLGLFFEFWFLWFILAYVFKKKSDKYQEEPSSREGES